jgi:TIR domain/NB-ARC domain
MEDLRMPKVFPCYAAADRELARELAAFLERGAGVEVLLEEGEMQPGENLIAKVEEGLSADVVVALLSPAAVPPRWPLERWTHVFRVQAAEVGTAVATLLCRDCKFPGLLRRSRFFDARASHLAAFRALKRWLLSLWPPAQRAPFVPAHQPSFTGRATELEQLCTLLADAPGMAVVSAAPGAGKTALALEFTRRHREDFDGVFWLGCGTRSAAALAGDLAAQLGVRLDRDLESNLNELRQLCARYRCLLVLDDAVAPAAAWLAPRGRTSVLVTTRQDDLAAALSAAALPIDHAGAPQAAPDKPQPLLDAMSACAPSGFLLEMAERTAGLDPQEARDMAAALLAQGSITELDHNGPRFLAPARDSDEHWARRHALAVAELFGTQSWMASDLTAYWPDLQHALAWAWPRAADPQIWPLACQLASRGVRWARAQDRLAEAFEILQAWSQAASQQADRHVLEDCAWEQIWILEHWGRSSEAHDLDGLRRREFADQMAFDFSGGTLS